MKICELHIDASAFEQQGLILKKALEEVSVLCSEFLKFYEEAGPMYHGFQSAPSNIFVGEPHTDRKPLSLTYKEQYEIDKKLSLAGFHQLRGNSLFCIGNITTASEYGAVYQIFPKNGFRYTWSDFCDLVTDIRYTEMMYDLHSLSPNDFADKYEFRENMGLSLALQQGKEIYLGGEFIAISELMVTRHSNTYLQWTKTL